MIRFIKNSRFSVFILILGYSFFVASCGCEEDCAEFSEFRLCDSKPVEEGCSNNANSFAQDADYFTVSVEIKHGEPDDRLSLKLFFNDNGNFTEFASQSLFLKDIDGDLNGDERKIRASTGVSRRSDRLWPVGEYKVEIELTQENIPLNATQNFTVQ